MSERDIQKGSVVGYQPSRRAEVKGWLVAEVENPTVILVREGKKIEVPITYLNRVMDSLFEYPFLAADRNSI